MGSRGFFALSTNMAILSHVNSNYTTNEITFAS